MRLPNPAPYALIYYVLSLAFPISLVNTLYQDQVGKFDWRRQYVGIPKFVYRHPGLDNLIVGTESNVVASILVRDGSIVWRKLLPNDCKLSHLSVLKSHEDIRDYLIRTSCNSSASAAPQVHLWNPQNGLLSSESRYREIAEDERAESQLSDEGHLIGNQRSFTISNNIELVVSDDGQVTLQSHNDILWTREESLASVTSVEISRLPADMRDRFGLKKRIILITDLGKIFGLDTITGEQVWDLFDPDLSTKNQINKAFLTLTKQSDENAEDSRAVIVHQDGVVVQINPITGKVIDKKKLQVSVKQLSPTGFNEEDNSRGIILLDTQDKIHIYPEEYKFSVIDQAHKYYLVVANKKHNRIEGYKLNSKSLTTEVVWTFPFNETEQIINLGIKRVDEEVHSPARVLGDRGILYKYVNPNLMAVMTQGSYGGSCNPDNYLNVYLIDGVTGSLVHSTHHVKSRGPSEMVHSENWLVYSYYSTRNRRTEVSSLEMFEGVTQSNSEYFSSLDRAAIKPKLIEHKSFIFPGGIDAMVDTTTTSGMTNKHIIAALPSGALLEIPKIFLDPRRPINMQPEHREEGLIPYMPELPIPSESIINYDQTLLGVRRITTSPAMLESTSLVFAYGLDLFFTRVTPSKTFDILKDDFDHVLITAVLVFLVVASYVSKLLAQRKALRAAWK